MVVSGEPPSRFGPLWALYVRAAEWLRGSDDEEGEVDDEEGS